MAGKMRIVGILLFAGVLGATILSSDWAQDVSRRGERYLRYLVQQGVEAGNGRIVPIPMGRARLVAAQALHEVPRVLLCC